MDRIELHDISDEEEGYFLTRKLMGSGFSFAISMIVHLSIFLVLAFIFRSTLGSGTITLELNAAAKEDLSTTELAIVSFVDVSDALEISEGMESELEAFEEAELVEVFDFGSLEEFPAAFSGNLDNPKPKESGEKSKPEKKRENASKGFFGIEATGNRVVYIIDMSPSMQNGYPDRRFDRAVNEVLSSIDQLKPGQEFFVYLFCFAKYEMPLNGTNFAAPTDRNIRALQRWLRSRRLESGTDPREAIVAALERKPTCCFLLSDGEFNGRHYGTGRYAFGASAVELAKKHNELNCPIHTVGLEDKGSQRDMTKIAEDSGGTYKFVSAVR